MTDNYLYKGRRMSLKDTAKCHFTELYPSTDKETGAPIILPTETQIPELWFSTHKGRDCRTRIEGDYYSRYTIDLCISGCQ